MKHKIIIALGMLIISGCVSTKNNNVYKAENHIKEKNDIYATLKKDINGNYSFDKFSFKSMENSINLNTLIHNYSKKEVFCGPDKGGLCAEDALFSRPVNASIGGDVLSTAVLNIIAVPVSILLLDSKFGLYYTAEFDPEGFDEALNEALSKTDRKALILEANGIVSKHQYALSQASSKFKTLQKHIDENLDKSVQMVDVSQLYPSKPQVATIVSKRLKGSLKLESVWASTQELNNNLSNKVESSIKYGEISLSCKRLNDFNYKVVGCQQSWSYSSAPVIEPITYSISSAKKYTFYPIIKAIDENLTISSTKTGQIEIINNTNSFITLSSLSFYLGNNIETLSNLNLELPPGIVSKNLNMNKFKAYSNNRTLHSIIKKDLNKKVAIGIATKYKIIDTNVEKTIYKKSNYKYSDLGGYVG